jgi:hypothetical protein
MPFLNKKDAPLTLLIDRQSKVNDYTYYTQKYQFLEIKKYGGDPKAKKER